MFIGRTAELSVLNEKFEKDNFELFFVIGRRRIGKTTLIREFCKNKKAIFFSAKEESKKPSLDSFSRTLNNYMGNPRGSSFVSFEALFEEIYDRFKDERLIVVIDEFPYAVNADKSLMSTLQHLIDLKFKDTKMFFVLCGSSISFMERKVLSHKAPLFGRRTGQIRLSTVSFKDSTGFFPNFSKEDKIIAYSIMGGTPKYLSLFDDGKSIKCNVIDCFLNTFGILYEEPLNLLKQELREPALYNSIIEAIATGSTKINDISTAVGQERDKTAKYIGQLIELQIVNKEIPVTEGDRSKKTIYHLTDDMFRFWYRFVYKNMESLGAVDNSILYDEAVEPFLNAYVAKSFENICKEHLQTENLNMRLPFSFLKIGRWWGNNPKLKSEEEIDFLAINKDRAFFVECKWRNERTGISVLADLKRKSENLIQFTDKYYVLYSKSGYDSELVKLARQDEHILLYSLDDVVVE